MGEAVRSFFSAISFLTVIPVPDGLKSRRENGMFAGYPLAGLIIGLLLTALAAAVQWLFPPAVAAGVLVALSLALTGALHLDGLADCADAFYGQRDRETVLRILKDPRVGTMGAAAIVLALLLRGAAFFSLPAGVLILSLPVAGLFSRSVVLVALRILPYVRSESGILGARPPKGTVRTVIGAAAVLAALVLLPIPTAAALVCLALFWRVAWKKIGGCTGDVLGATIEIGEVVFFAALTAAVKGGVRVGLLYSLLTPR